LSARREALHTQSVLSSTVLRLTLPRPRPSHALSFVAIVAGLAVLGGCVTTSSDGALPVAVSTTSTTQDTDGRAMSPLDEPTGTVTAPSRTTTAPPTVTVTSIPPSPSPTSTRPKPKSSPTTKATPKATPTPTTKPKPSSTPKTTTAPQTPVTGSTVAGCGNPNPGKVLLTFDDGGPKAGALLSILDRYNIKARWFPTGQWANANGAMIQRLLADGQMMGNHTYSHTKMSASLGRAELARQVDLGYHPTRVFRFPYGASDATSRAIVTGKGYSICGWSIDTLDWRGSSADTIYRTVTSQAKPGSVVLMHMSFQADVDALPRIIENLRSRGLI
jgi:peptidoglycan-N-acetylglucosamine deacetylase